MRSRSKQIFGDGSKGLEELRRLMDVFFRAVLASLVKFFLATGGRGGLKFY